MIANDELQNYMCKKYDHNCIDCVASLYNKSGLEMECSFDRIDVCLAEYMEDKDL